MNLILLLLATGILAALCIPAVTILSAKLGLVEPFQLDAFGHVYEFEPWRLFARPPQ